MKSRTQDEKFIIALYELSEKFDEDRKVFNRYEIGKSISLNPRGVNAICKLLLQANFIKKAGEEEVYITDNGASLAKRLLEDY